MSNKNTLSKIKIIGGKWKGTNLTFHDEPELRPTGNRIRETLFNWLQPYIQGSTCLDLFAGSGCLGLEALSRGASKCVMVEKNERVKSQLAENIEKLSASTELIHDDAINYLSSKAFNQTFDIVFIDPPFNSNLYVPTIRSLETNNWLSHDALIYIEAGSDSSMFQIIDNWSLFREQVAGKVRYMLYSRSDTKNIQN
jgi:16S rRNA (guanine966-N2)-methyltransferase